MSVATFDPSAPAITLTDAAHKFFAKKLASQPGKMIRLSTKVSGCTGFSYVLDLVDQAEAEDTLIDTGDLTLAVAATALEQVQGTVIDLSQDGINQVIKYNNPNVVAECGCGESFSVS